MIILPPGDPTNTHADEELFQLALKHLQTGDDAHGRFCSDIEELPGRLALALMRQMFVRFRWRAFALEYLGAVASQTQDIADGG
jgi:hypothetical protein